MATHHPDQYILRSSFRYQHEPISEELAVAAAVGRKPSAQQLADRIVLSRGGAFLVSGLRGVGKTTCVRLAIQLIRSDRERFKRMGEDAELVDVWINLARPLKPVQLLHHLIRHLYLRLKETGLLAALDTNLRADLHTAFLRTSFEISSRSLMEEERGRGSEAGFAKAPWLGIEFLGKLSSIHKTRRSDEEALKYLPYDEKVAEFDILSFCRRLLNTCPPEKSRWRRWLLRICRIHAGQPRIRVLFVLDELDKLEGRPRRGHRSPLDTVLQTLKGVFTSSGFSFVFIGGKEVEQRLVEDVSRGDSIYESIFAYDLYLGCLWEEQHEIVRQCFEQHTPVSHRHTLSLYLRYRGRGVPRRIWREINRLVLWKDTIPFLAFDTERRRYMEVFAKIEEALEGTELFVGRSTELERVQIDRRRLCFYYTLDWTLARGKSWFTRPEVVDIVRTLNFGGVGDNGFSEQIATAVINLLTQRAFIERIDREITLIGQTHAEAMYRLASWVRLALQAAPDQDLVGREVVHPSSPAQASAALQTIGPYHVVQKLGEGGFSTVYKVTEKSGQLFAAKILNLRLTGSASEAAALFASEKRMLQLLDHPGIVRIHDAGMEQGYPFIILDLLEGFTLRELLASVRRLDVAAACTLTRELARICAYIHRCGIVRLDVKPANVFLTEHEIKIIDLGIATKLDEVPPTHQEAALGTPAYMAPEQLAGQPPDPRADIFSLGVVLHEALTGQEPPAREFLKAFEPLPPVSQYAALPEKLDRVLQKALAQNPAERFQTMDELAEAVAPFSAKDMSAVLLRLSTVTRHRFEDARTYTRSVHGISLSGDQASLVTSGLSRMRLKASRLVEAAVDNATRDRSSPSQTAEKRVECPYCNPAVLASVRAPLPPGITGAAATHDEASGSPPGHQESPQDHFFLERDPAGADAANETASRQRVAPNHLFEAWIQELVSRLRHGYAAVENEAYSNLCHLTLQHGASRHLVFDLARQVCLWCDPDGRMARIPLESGSLKMGRSSSAVELPLDHPSVSRQHAAFFPLDGVVDVEDLATANGTVLNGHAIRREHLSELNSLKLGECEIAVHVLPKQRTLRTVS